MTELGDGYIHLQGLSKIYHTDAGEFVALEGVNAVFHQGEFTSVVGRSGSGKSTLMNMITGIDKPSQGRVLINGREIQRYSESKMAAWRGRNLGIIFQFYQLLPVLSLLENVMLPMQLAGRGTAAQQMARAHALLKAVGVDDLADKRPYMVSGGQQQSTAIARALANDPPILIADEPTGNLGTRAGETIIRIFQMLAGKGKTIIMVTHDQQLAGQAQRVLQISDGRILTETQNAGRPALNWRKLQGAS